MPFFDEDIVPEKLFANVKSLSPTWEKMAVTGFFPKTGQVYQYQLTLSLANMTRSVIINTSIKQTTPFVLDYLITEFRASSQNYFFLGPHSWQVTDLATSETISGKFYQSFYFPIYKPTHLHNSRYYILSNNSQLN